MSPIICAEGRESIGVRFRTSATQFHIIYKFPDQDITFANSEPPSEGFTNRESEVPQWVCLQVSHWAPLVVFWQLQLEQAIVDEELFVEDELRCEVLVGMKVGLQGKSHNLNVLYTFGQAFSPEVQVTCRI